MRALIVRSIVALVVAAIAFFFAIMLPVLSDFEIHNPFWESLFGIGFGITELFHMDTRGDALLGFLLWPLFTLGAVWFAAFYSTRASRRTRVIAASFFILSLLICVGRDTQNSLAVHVPLWSNEYFVRY
jgi:hypothetical protein